MDSVLVIDDDKSIRSLVAQVLAGEQFAVHTAGTGVDGLRSADDTSPDVVLLDLRLPDMDGLEILKALKGRHPEAAVIIITAFGQIQSAVEAIKNGATDYLEKPFDSLDRLRLAVARALEQGRARRELDRLHRLEEKQYSVDQIVGESASTRQLRALITKLARSEAPTILIRGESGTGKELVARGLHYESPRRQFPFMEVNCAAIAETLFESEVFGHEKGAFTDARASRKGLMEMADHGTLFLDEISEMSLTSQAKLLRCLQERVFKRVGGTRDIKVDLRVVAATNQPLEARVKEGTFREDLFYRLNVIPIVMTPLRERPDDVLPLARHFLAEANHRFHKSIRGFDQDAEQRLIAYPWPGNVRELKNLIEQLVILDAAPIVCPEQLPMKFTGRTPAHVAAIAPIAPTAVPGFRTLADVERAHIAQILQTVESNKSKAAKILGISRQTLRRKLQEA